MGVYMGGYCFIQEDLVGKSLKDDQPEGNLVISRSHGDVKLFTMILDARSTSCLV
jgi:hypothetical protein